MAILFGNSSPRTSEKYEIKIVISISESEAISPFTEPSDILKSLVSHAVRMLLNEVAATAEVRNPARVTPT